jgi:formiminotetrahydrofolate cyclodeaminase
MKIKEQKIKDFLEVLSSKSPTPGGGAAAALVGAMAAALVEMVINLSQKLKGKRQKLGEIRRLRNHLLELADKDVIAFDAVMAAYRSKKGIQEALKNATEIPLQTALLSNEVLDLAKEISKKGNKNAASDAKSALYMAKAARASALENVKINLDLIKDVKYNKKVLTRINQFS